MRRSGGHSDLGTLVFQHQICLDRSEQGPLGTWVQPAYMLCWVLWVALICSDTAVASECCDTVTLGWMNIGLVRVWLGGSKELLSELTKIKTSHSLGSSMHYVSTIFTTIGYGGATPVTLGEVPHPFPLIFSWLRSPKRLLQIRVFTSFSHTIVQSNPQLLAWENVSLILLFP